MLILTQIFFAFCFFSFSLLQLIRLHQRQSQTDLLITLGLNRVTSRLVEIRLIQNGKLPMNKIRTRFGS